MDLNPIILSIPIYFLLIGIELLIERFSHKKIYRLNDAITNISCGITQQLTGIFFKVLGVGAYAIVFNYLAVYETPSTWWSFAILFVAADFCYYWAHRMSHEINLFWGGHVVHHQSEDYNFSVALRQGSFQIIWTFAFYLPLAVIGFSPVDFVLASALVTVYQFWIHTETIGKLGWLEKIFNTPSHHRVHHGRNPKYIDRNHAGVFIIWDRMFGTFQEEEERPTYGITTPINSWNPVWVNLNHYNEMWQQLKQIKGTGNKLKYIFYKPGWLPEEMGGYQPAPEIDHENYQKYDPAAPGKLNIYVLFQYIITLSATAFFLFQYQSYTLPEQLLFLGAIILTIVNSGALFELKTWVWTIEKLRIIAVSTTLIYLPFYKSWPLWYMTPGIVYFLISMGWLLYAGHQIEKQTITPAK